MPISPSVAKVLWGISGGRCYFDPTEELTATPSGDQPIGEIAHIVGKRQNGPRGTSSMTLKERDSIGNLIILCPNHHRELDNHPEVWTVAKLRVLKERHETWVRKVLNGNPLPERLDFPIGACGVRAQYLEAERFDPVWQSLKQLILILGDRAERLYDYISKHQGRDSANHFKALHKKHIECLKEGNFIRAHEALWDIHFYLENLFYRTHRFPFGPGYSPAQRPTVGPLASCYISGELKDASGWTETIAFTKLEKRGSDFALERTVLIYLNVLRTNILMAKKR